MKFIEQFEENNEFSESIDEETDILLELLMKQNLRNNFFQEE